MPIKKNKSKKAKKSSKRTTKPKRKSYSFKKGPIKFGKSCFKKTMVDSRGFQAADLKPEYFKAFMNLYNKYGSRIVVKPTGNPGISVSLAT